MGSPYRDCSTWSRSFVWRSFDCSHHERRHACFDWIVLTRSRFQSDWRYCRWAVAAKRRRMRMRWREVAWSRHSESWCTPSKRAGTAWSRGSGWWCPPSLERGLLLQKNDTNGWAKKGKTFEKGFKRLQKVGFLICRYNPMFCFGRSVQSLKALVTLKRNQPLLSPVMLIRSTYCRRTSLKEKVFWMFEKKEAQKWLTTWRGPLEKASAGDRSYCWARIAAGLGKREAPHQSPTVSWTWADHWWRTKNDVHGCDEGGRFCAAFGLVHGKC